MCEHNTKSGNKRIDPCMNAIIDLVKITKFVPLACCCGHGKYVQTIVVRDKTGPVYDLVSNQIIKRKKKFYHKDAEGVYFIPESTKFWKIKK